MDVFHGKDLRRRITQMCL